MNKAVTIAIIGAASVKAANSYARGVPPVTQNCRNYPAMTEQTVAWGLVVDREFGGCRCADQTEQEWGPKPNSSQVAFRVAPDTPQNYDNTWACQCLNTDLVLEEIITPSLQGTVVGGAAARLQDADDVNGKKCGVVANCQTAGVNQQRTMWNREAARALQTRDSARVYAKKSMMPDGEVTRARTLRIQATKNNRARARVQVAALALRYRAIKNAMIAGSLDKSAFQNAYKKVAAQIATYRAEWRNRQKGIEETWNLILARQRSAEAYVAADLNKIEEIYEQTLASLADRYGKRIAYMQSLPVVVVFDQTGTAVTAFTPITCALIEE